MSSNRTFKELEDRDYARRQRISDARCLEDLIVRSQSKWSNHTFKRGGSTYKVRNGVLESQRYNQNSNSSVI